MGDTPYSLPGDVFGHYPSRKKREAIFRPLLIGAICKAWRDVAWATPQLWAQPFFDHSIIRDLDRHPLAIECLSRAQRVPVTLNITLQEPHYPLAPGAETLRSFLKSISGFPLQLKTISARMTFKLMQYMFHHARTWDNIDNLLLCPTAGSIDSFLAGQPLFLGEVKPSPRNVAIVLGPVTIDRVNIDWSRVKEASVKNLSQDESVEFLHSHPTLNKCEFIDIKDGPHLTEPSVSAITTAITLQHLQSLSLSNFRSQGRMFFSRLILPNLLYFSFNKDGTLTDTSTEILSFFQQSRPLQLQKLELVGVEFILHDLKLLLQIVPAVSHLHLPIPQYLSDHGIGDEFRDPIFCHLAETMNEPGLFVPRLNVIELTPVVYVRDMPWNIVAAIVASLYQADRQDLPQRRPLKTFRFNLHNLWGKAIPTSTRRILYELTQAGAEIVVNDEVVVVSENNLEDEEKEK